MWRYSAGRLTIAGMSSACLLPFMIVVFRWAWWRYSLAGIAVFAVLGYFGITVPVMLRRLRCWWVGRRRDGTPRHKEAHYA